MPSLGSPLHSKGDSKVKCVSRDATHISPARMLQIQDKAGNTGQGICKGRSNLMPNPEVEADGTPKLSHWLVSRVCSPPAFKGQVPATSQLSFSFQGAEVGCPVGNTRGVVHVVWKDDFCRWKLTAPKGGRICPLGQAFNEEVTITQGKMQWQESEAPWHASGTSGKDMGSPTWAVFAAFPGMNELA